MFPLLAALPIRTKPGEIERAYRAPHMSLRAPWPERTEAPDIVLADGSPRLGVDVEVVAVVAAAAVPAGEVRALGPGADVVFVQEVAGVALFAEALEPVLADEVV